MVGAVGRLQPNLGSTCAPCNAGAMRRGAAPKGAKNVLLLIVDDLRPEAMTWAQMRDRSSRIPHTGTHCIRGILSQKTRSTDKAFTFFLKTL